MMIDFKLKNMMVENKICQLIRRLKYVLIARVDGSSDATSNIACEFHLNINLNRYLNYQYAGAWRAGPSETKQNHDIEH